MSLSPGTRIGLYEIVSLLGAGGMGEVYRARDTKLGRDIAVKVLPEPLATDPDRIARFEREARALAALNHPHIATLYGLEESGGHHFLVMELVDGETLAERLQRGPIRVDEALPIAMQIADALEAAHEKGIVHRDLKPANIAMTDDGRVKVLDFGLAKALEAATPSAVDISVSPTITTPAMTGMGVILGTAAYMSPEQAKGRPADKRSDVWACGCVLYEMLSGKRAFEGEDVGDTLAAVIRGEPDWNALPASVSSPIRSLIQRCLAKDRRQRVSDMAVVKFVITEPGVGLDQRRETLVAAPATPRWKALLPVAAAVAGTAALMIVGATMFWPSTSPPVVTRFVFTLPEGQTLTANVPRSVLGISPDGTKLVYIASNRLFLRSLSEFESHPIPGTEVAVGVSLFHPVFSPDGQSIVYSSSERVLKRVALAGGAGVKLCTVEPPSGMSWDANGIVLGQRTSGVFRCSPDGGAAEQIARVKEGEEVNGPQLLPGGKALIFTLAKSADGPARWDKARIVVQALGSGARKTLMEGGSDARYLPTGHLLYAVGGVVYAVPFDPTRQQITGGAVPVVEGVRRGAVETTFVSHIAVSNNGTLAYLPGPIATATVERSVAIADRAGTVTRLSLPAGPYMDVRASRDGARVAIGSDDGKQAIIWVYELAGIAAPRRLTLDGNNRFPVWSPDTRRVAFQSDREKDLGIFMQRADGTGLTERLTKPEQGDAHVPLSWSPDGKQFLFASLKGPTWSLWILSLEEKKVARFGDVESREPIGAAFSPDGRWIAYTSNPTATETPTETSSPNRGVYLQPFPPTGERYQAPRRALDFHPVWSPKGTELFYVPSAASGQLAVVSVATTSGVTFGSPVLLPARVTADRRTGEMRAWDILPDGRFIGLVSPSGPDSSTASTSNQIRVVTNWFEELKQRVPVK